MHRMSKRTPRQKTATTPHPSDILDDPPKQAFEKFLQRCESYGVERKLITDTIALTLAYLRDPTRSSEASLVLQTRWFESLERKAPDFSVYDEDAYLAELWSCWDAYSRAYLRNLRTSFVAGTERTIYDDLASPKRIVDLGCGFGYTTAALKQLFPEAEVYGTNLDGTVQTRMARDVAGAAGAHIVADVRDAGSAQLVLASEYFEHIPDPIADLERALALLKPRSLLVANSFGTRGLGHFHHYCVKGVWMRAKEAARLFDATLRKQGYEKVKTTLWNNRPTYWRKAGA